MKKLVVFNHESKSRFSYTTLTVVTDNVENMEKIREDYKVQIEKWERNLSKSDNESSTKYITDLISKLKKELDSLRVINACDYTSELEKLLLKAPEEITEELYDEMLNVLPPLRCTLNGFLMCEFITLNYTCHFFKKDNKYYWEIVKVKPMP